MAEKKDPKKQDKKEFQYEGRGPKGQKIAGVIAADTAPMAKALLRKQGITNVKLKAKKATKAKAVKGVNPMDIAIFARQMATMQQAGIPLVQAFSVVIEGTDKESLAKLVSQVKESVESGMSFSEALRGHPKDFDELFCNLIEAGEQSGTLEQMLDRIAVYKEKTESLKRKLKKAMYYPVTVLFIALIVTLILLIKVVPTFKELFEGFGAELPGFTMFVLGISELVQEYGLQVLLAFAGLGWLCWYAYKTRKNVRHGVERTILKLPIFGPIFTKATIARFARTLSTTFAAGVPLTDALVSVAKASGNIVYYNAIIQIKDNVSAGQQMQAAMARSGIFPNMVIQMVGIGEESGTLEQMLGKVASIFEEEVDTAVDGLSTLLEPLIMLILGVLVGGLVIAMYLPIFKLGSVI